MSNLPQFLAYAADFERTFADDDFTRLERYFADDVVYEIAGLPSANCSIRGRANVFAGIKRSIDGFDRKMHAREMVSTDPPTETGNTMKFFGLVHYQRTEDPASQGDLHATIDVEFTDDGRIRYMRDSFTIDRASARWLMTYTRDLDGSYVAPTA